MDRMYTVLLTDGSFYVDGPTRDQIQLAESVGASAITIVVASTFSCSQRHTASIRPKDIVAFIAHDELAPRVSRDSNVVALHSRG